MRKIFLLFSLLLMLTAAVQAQNRTVTGTVTDKTTNEALPGVTIQVKGSTTATATDVNGRFSIKVTNLQNVTIGAKFLGYDFQEVTLPPGTNTLNFQLTASSKGLDEVVVVGYGEQKKISLTGDVQTIDIKKIEDLPSLNLSSSLAGLLPGVSVVQGSQRPGQPVTLQVRNPVSLTANGPTGTAPLYVIDDQIRTATDFNLLDANEIESISILKDAEGAIYGIQGANGVILVRTKRGKIGAPKITFSGSVGVEAARQLPKMLSGLQLGTFVDDYYQSANNYQISPDGFLPGVSSRVSTFYTPDELAYFAQNNTNYLAQAFTNAVTERGAVNVSGGSDKVTYFIGGDYVNQGSNFHGVNAYKYGLRASVEAKPAKGLTVSLNLNNEISYNRDFWYKFGGEALDNDVISLTVHQPWQPFFINGIPTFQNGTASTIDNINVFLYENSNNYTGGTTNSFNALGKIAYEIPGVKGLVASVSIDENYNNQNNKQYGTTFNYGQFSGTGENNHIPGGTLLKVIPEANGNKVRLTPTFATSYQLDASLAYNRTFGKHSISLLAIYEQRENHSEGVAAEADGVIVGGYDNQNFTTGTTANGGLSSSQSSMISNTGALAYIGRFNYSYDNKYLFQATERIDGSTYYLPGLNYGYFPSGSLGWVVSNENWMKKYNWIDLLKVRASVGLLGSINTPAYQYQNSFSFGTGSGGGAVFNEGLRGTGIQFNLAQANPNVTWDHTVKEEYGIDMQFLKSRLTVGVDYYFNHGYDLLTSISSGVPQVVGAALPSENFGIENTFGYEITAGWRDHVGKNWSYSFTPFFAWQDNKAIRVDEATGLIGTFQDVNGGSTDKGVLGLRYTNFLRTQDDVNAILAKYPNYTINGLAPKPGMLNFQDLNGDGKIDASDLQYLTKKSGNHYSLGLNFGGSYKSLTLSVVAGMSFGGQNAISGSYDLIGGGSTTPIIDNHPVYWADHWTPSNPNAKYPAPYYTADYNTYTSNFWFVSSTTLNITSANLSYTVPTKWSSKIGVSSARLYAQGYNLISFLNPYPDHFRDPETGTNAYPAIRTITLGLSVGF